MAKLFKIILIAFIFFFIPVSQIKADLNVPITVKNSTESCATNYPITAVISLPKAKYYNLDHFQIIDSKGNYVPAQFEVLTRWWSEEDQRLRHVFVSFLGEVKPKDKTVYYFRDDSEGNSIETSLKVKETNGYITVITGPIKFVLKKHNFNLFDGVWLDKNHNGQFTKDEQIIISDPRNGGVLTDRFGNKQYDSEANDVQVTIEEQGPVRVVIKAEAPTHFIDGGSAENSNVIHGYQVRIYAYAEQPFVKVEYTLRNTDKTVKYSFPMYMKDFSIRLKTAINQSNGGILRFGKDKNSKDYYRNSLKDGGKYLYQSMHDQYAIYDIKGNKIEQGNHSQGWADLCNQFVGITTAVRWFWQTWPKGFEIKSDGTIYTRLWPKWGRDYYWRDKNGHDYVASAYYSPADVDLYWLDDMQQKTYNLFYYFHNGSADPATIRQQVNLFLNPPLGVLAVNWYAQTQANFDWGGVIPQISKKLEYKLIEKEKERGEKPSLNSHYYNLGWLNFAGRMQRRRSGECGGMPTTLIKCIYLNQAHCSETLVLGEIEARNWWLPHYSFEKDDKLLKLTHYGRDSWRWCLPGNPSYWKITKYPYLLGTGHHGWNPMDTEHFWVSHFEEFYYLTGEKKIKEWYEFLGEHHKIFLLDPKKDPRVWISATRARGHILHSMVEAYRVTGRKDFLETAKQFFIKKIKPLQDKQFGYWEKRKYLGGEAPYEMGYLARALVYLYDALPENAQLIKQEIQDVVQGMVDWYINYAWGYYRWLPDKDLPSRKIDKFSVYQIDPLAWIYLKTGLEKYKAILEQYGKGRCEKTLYNTRLYQGRFALWVLEHPKSDIIPPAAITDLKAEPGPEAGSVRLSWTAPGDDGNKGRAVRYQIKYDRLPIVEDVTKWYPNMEEIRKRIPFWAATNVQGEPKPAPAGTQETFIIKNLSPGTYYFAIKSYDDENNQSGLSNIVCISL